MRATSVGHAGILIDTVDGSILCDPWFLPAFFGSWFVFPRNDQLPTELMERIEHPTTSTSPTSTPTTSTRRGSPTTSTAAPRSCIPGYPTRELERRIRSLGFDNIIRTTDGQELALGPNLTRRHPRRDEHHRRARRRLGAGRQRRHRRGSSTRTTAAPTTSTRCAPTARSICTGCSTAARSGTRWSTRSRRNGCASWSTPRSTASSPGRCATSRRSAPAPSCRAPGRLRSSIPSCSSST